MKVVPQVFYKSQAIEKIMVDGLCCIIRKSTANADLQNQRYLSAHAITLVLNGGLIIEEFDGTIRRIGKDQLVFLPKGLYMITDIIPDTKPFEAIVFFFDEEITTAFLKDFVDSKDDISNHSMVFDYKATLRLFVDSTLSLYGGKQQHQITRSKLYEFLHLLANSKNGTAFVTSLFSLGNREKKSIRSFMEDHFDKPLDIEDYAYLTGRSISTFQRDFKRRYQISPKKWLIAKRLDKAAEILQNNTYTVTRTMQEVGYENPSHFIKAFHKRFGISPKQYQIKYRTEVVI